VQHYYSAIRKSLISRKFRAFCRENLPGDAAAKLVQVPLMISPFIRMLGGLAGLGGAVLFWFLGDALSRPIRSGELFRLDVSQYALFAFLLVPALVLAVVALFWVPPREVGQGPSQEGRRLRMLLAVIFLAAFVIGVAR
jgi:hypothetical protein